MTQRTEIRKRLTKAIRELEAVEREVAVLANGGPLNLVGAKEVAEILGIRPGTVASRLSRGIFPVKPIVTLACGPVWHRAEIEALA